MAYAKSAVSSQQIIDAAIRVLARRGYARTSLLDIAKEAGMSKGALHYHYPTKEALIHAVLETACNVVQARTMQAWSPSDNPFEALRKSLEELWATRAERTDEALVVADLLALSLYDESFRPKLAEFYGLGAQQIRDYLEEKNRAIRHALDAGLQLGLNCTATRRTLPELRALVAHGVSLGPGVRNMTFGCVAPVGRFLIEFLRAKDDRMFGAFTLAQVTSVALVLVGAYLLSALYGAKEVPPGEYLSTQPGKA